MGTDQPSIATEWLFYDNRKYFFWNRLYFDGNRKDLGRDPEVFLRNRLGVPYTPSRIMIDHVGFHVGAFGFRFH